nr:MAG TPA: G-rich domain on putative tyrosine kinase [Caudoviricetes sp.]
MIRMLIVDYLIPFFIGLMVGALIVILRNGED